MMRSVSAVALASLVLLAIGAPSPVAEAPIAHEHETGPQTAFDTLDEYQHLPLVARNHSADLVLGENTKPLSGATTRYLVSVSPDGARYTFSQTTPELDSVQPGDIIAGGVTQATPYGFLRKVRSVHVSAASPSAGASQVVFTTEHATLAEAIEDGVVHETKCFDPVSVPINEQLYDEEDGKVGLTGSVAVKPCLDFRAEFDDHHLEELSFINTTVETATLTLRANVEKSIEEENEVLSVLLPRVGAPPVVIVPELSVDVGLTATLEAGFSAGITQTAVLTAGLTYDDDADEKYSWFAEHTNQFEPATPTFTGTLDAKAYAAPRLSLWIDGFVGPYGGIDGYLRAEADINATPWWQLYGGLEGVVGVKAQVLDPELAAYEKRWRIREWLLAQAKTYTIWVAQASGTAGGLLDVDFLDANTGWAVGGDNEVLRTTNGGTTWLLGRVQADHVGAVSFITSQAGWVGGRSGVTTQVFRTSDGGTEWTLQYEREEHWPLSVHDIEFLDPRNGWLVADFGYRAIGGSGVDVLWVTDDGGGSWNPMLTSLIHSVAFLPSGHGWAVGYGYGIPVPPHPWIWSTSIHKTTDGGQTWLEQSSPVSTGLLAVHFVDNSNGWAVGREGAIVYTSNGGAKWVVQQSEVTVHLRDVLFADSLQGWVVGDGGTLLHTADGGRSWQAEPSGTTDDLCAIDAGDATRFWVVGTGGTILHGQRHNLTAP
jgi:photosystem II stability/assembly factor-like uncharacterized protein